MPSYRVTVTIGSLRPGAQAEEVLPTAAHTVADLTTLEASSVSLARGVPQVVVRFTAEDDEIARQVGAEAVRVVAALAEVEDGRLTRRSGSAWRTVPWSE